METNKCQTCNGNTAGFKCEVCGEEATSHDNGHSCGAESCRPKCEGCSQADTKCVC